MAKLEPYKGDYYLWHYLPSIPAAVLFTLLFLGITILQCWKLHNTRSWFCICFVLGCICETIGYPIRIAAHHHTSQLTPFILQSLFILIGPAFYAASIYMTLSRLLRFLHASHHSLIPIKWLTRAFLLGDWLSLMIQGNSASLTMKDSTRKIGEGMIVAGLFVQIISFSFFFVTTIVFHVRIEKAPTTESLITEVKWRRILKMLYLVSVLILMRSVFRVVEYLMGYEGYLFMNEWTLYVFDAVPMWIVAVAFWWCWPSEVGVVKRENDGVELLNGSSFRGWLTLRRFRK